MQATAEKLSNTWPRESLASGELLFRGASFIESLARAHFLVERRKLLGLLVGEAGSGRSTLLVTLADELRRGGIRVARLHLYGVSADEMLWALAAELGLNPRPDATTGRLWREITDSLAAARFEQQHVAMLLDDVDRAQPDAIAALLRIAKCDPAAEGQQTLILGCRSDRVAALGSALLELAALRIELCPWSASETEEYLARTLRNASKPKIHATHEAAARLYELSAGMPRRVHQLLDLAVVAAQAQAARCIDRSLLDAVDSQLAFGCA
jgi:type II secretory pathway predicted ATPase ExeA